MAKGQGLSVRQVGHWIEVENYDCSDERNYFVYCYSNRYWHSVEEELGLVARG